MHVPKKILIVITKGDVGGAQVFVHNLARGLKQKGMDVAVGMGEGAFLKAKLLQEHIPVIEFVHLKRTSNPFSALLFILELRRFLKKEQYDAVQFNSTNSLPGALGAKLAGKNLKTIFTVHGLSVLDKNYRTFFLARWAYWIYFRFFLSYVDMPVFVDQHDLEKARRLGIVLRGTVIYNGIDEATMRFMERSAARDAISKNIGREIGDNFVLGSIGRLSYQKNYEFFIRSFRDILAIKPNAIAVVIGDGPQHMACEELIKKLGLQDSFFLLGEMNNASSYLKAFDLFVLPSRYEGLPITLTECLFARVPVLATDVGGNREVTGEHSLYPLNGKAEFMQKISEAAQDSSKLLCDSSKKELFSPEKMSAGYVELFGNLAR